MSLDISARACATDFGDHLDDQSGRGGVHLLWIDHLGHWLHGWCTRGAAFQALWWGPVPQRTCLAYRPDRSGD